MPHAGREGQAFPGDQRSWTKKAPTLSLSSPSSGLVGGRSRRVPYPAPAWISWPPPGSTKNSPAIRHERLPLSATRPPSVNVVVSVSRPLSRTTPEPPGKASASVESAGTPRRTSWPRAPRCRSRRRATGPVVPRGRPPREESRHRPVSGASGRAPPGRSAACAAPATAAPASRRPATSASVSPPRAWRLTEKMESWLGRTVI